MRENTSKPAIRFAGFTDDWEQRKLGELASLITKGTTPLDKSNIGDINFVKIESIDESSGEITITQKITTAEHEGYLRRSQLKENDILFSIAGTLGRVTSVKSSILPANTNQALAIVRLKNGDLQYVKTYLKGKAVSNYIKRNPTIGAQPNLSLEQVESLIITLPTVEEQRKIGDYFSELDILITLHQHKYDKLVKVKKAMLEKMFPKGDAKVPEIRFAGFTDDWEQRKFEEVANRASAIAATPELPRVEYEDIISGAGCLNKDVFTKESMKAGIEFHVGDVLYGKLRPYLHNWLLPLFSGLAVGDFWVLQPQNVDSSFLYRLIQSQQFDEVANQSTGTKMPRADWKLVSKNKFAVPSSIQEQAQIGQFFIDFDHLITLHQRKLEKLKQIKSAMLEKMFV